MDNTLARAVENSRTMKRNGLILSDPIEESFIRREDFIKHAGQAEGDDLHQSGALPSTKSQRGHQGPAAFLIVASGLHKVRLFLDYNLINFFSSMNLNRKNRSSIRIWISRVLPAICLMNPQLSRLSVYTLLLYMKVCLTRIL